jgi:hypothetical protein
MFPAESVSASRGARSRPFPRPGAGAIERRRAPPGVNTVTRFCRSSAARTTARPRPSRPALIPITEVNRVRHAESARPLRASSTWTRLWPVSAT